jgi:hypothetical protein
MAQAPPVYVENLSIVVRTTERETGSEPLRALLGSLEVGEDFPLDDLVEEVHSWLVQERLEPFEVEVRRSVAQVGATGIGTEIAIWFLAGAGTIAMKEAWEFIKSRVRDGDRRVRQEFEYLRKRDSDDLSDDLAQKLARSLDARRAELRLVDLVRDQDEIRGIYETSTGERYIIRVAAEFFLIERVNAENGAPNWPERV